ncbi:MAG: family 16 glycosylhydrolase [Oligoflexales bacterium]|nr:family 16 glycosylhydrolase [Oligoflexales bacterium]
MKRLIKILCVLLFAENALSESSEQPLISAICNQNVDLVYTLLEEGADPREKKPDGTNAIQLALSQPNQEIRNMVLNHQDPDNGETYLIRQIYEDNYSVAKDLLAAGAEPFICKFDGSNAFDFANWSGDGRYRQLLETYQKRESDSWALVWSDEFDLEEIDQSKWTHEVDGLGGGNNELQYYTDRPENSKIEDSKLVIIAREEKFGPKGQEKRYTSARLNTKFKGDWKYGRFDIRAKLPYGKGTWPAIWMLPSNNKYGNWPTSGEIDIMEAVNLNKNGKHLIYASTHFGGMRPKNKSKILKFPTSNSLTNDYHTYSIEWEESEIRWYIDGYQYASQREWSTPGGDFPAPFDQEFHLLINLAIGGNFPGSPNSETQFPQELKIDYVRVYQRP